MHVQWFAHLPGVQLDASLSSHEVAEGRIGNLTFDEWCELDPSFPYSAAEYNESRPAFYIASAEIEGDLKAVLTQVSDRIYQFYQALLLDARVPWLPEPQLSVHYVRVNLKAGVATYRLVGPFEREWILDGNQIVYLFDSAALRSLDVVFELLAFKDECERNNPDEFTLPGINAGLEVLVRTARPDAWWDQNGVHHVNDFVHCTAALENLLVPANGVVDDLKITSTFGEHAAVLVSKSRQNLKQLAQSYAGLHRLRSNLIHGQMAMSDLNASDQHVLRLGRILLREVLIKAMALNKRQYDKVSIAMMLKKAYAEEAYHKVMHTQFREVEALI